SMAPPPVVVDPGWGELGSVIDSAAGNVDLLNNNQLGLTETQRHAIAAIRDMNEAQQNADEYHQKLAEDWAKEEIAYQKYAMSIEAATKSVKDSAGKVFDDMFIKGQNVFTSLKNALEGGVLSLGRSIFVDVAGALGGPIKS